MRVQNEGQGKSSWWMMNPDASKGNCGAGAGPTKHHAHFYRRRSNTLESAPSRSIEKRRAAVTTSRRRESSGSLRGLPSVTLNDLQRTASSSSLSYSDVLEFSSAMRPRTLSNASSCGGGHMSPPPFRPRTLSNASNTLEPPQPNPISSNQQQGWSSPIFRNFSERLTLDEASNDLDLEDINTIIDSEVGVANLLKAEPASPPPAPPPPPPPPPPPTASFTFFSSEAVNNNKIKVT